MDSPFERKAVKY